MRRPLSLTAGRGMGHGRRNRRAQRFSTVAAEAVGRIVIPSAVLAAKRSAGVFIALHHACDALHLREQEIPEAQDQRDARNDEKRVSNDGERGRLILDFDGRENRCAQQRPPGDGREDGDDKHQLRDAAGLAAAADDRLRQTDVVRMSLLNGHEQLQTPAQGRGEGIPGIVGGGWKASSLDDLISWDQLPLCNE